MERQANLLIEEIQAKGAPVFSSTRSRGQNLLATWSQIWSPRLINEVRVAWSRVSAGVFQENESDLWGWAASP